ncbi:hypothetical protein DV702_10785 [Sporosarcina sp. PTS2304]|nr:hypothetical protein DV702_10785 [Sporosarcina sp. PTS2304]
MSQHLFPHTKLLTGQRYYTIPVSEKLIFIQSMFGSPFYVTSFIYTLTITRMNRMVLDEEGKIGGGIYD